MASSQHSWKSREQHKQQKELEEARKAGTIAPLTDEDGNDISPHIPQYISQVPWYIQSQGPTLKHQRLRAEEANDKRWYTRGATKANKATKYRKGACENCGAMGHAAKFCLERPRKVGAKFSNKDIKADDLEMPELQLSYDGARDRWNGYDPNDHQKTVERFQLIEEERRRILEQQSNEKVQKIDETKPVAPTTTVQTPSVVRPELENAPEVVKKILLEDDEDELNHNVDQDADVIQKGDEDQVGSKVDARTRTTIRNLRIREDTAKYLLNLDPNSAFYDPKTRSMRSNPTPWKHPSEVEFGGENWVRSTGAAKEFDQLQEYAQQANEKGQLVHMEAAPSQLELIHRQFTEKKKILQQTERQQILAKYGGEEFLQAPAKELIFGQTEAYVEYAPDGQVLEKGKKKTVFSKWQENQFPGNHTSVWGSFWRDGRWGFSCCHQFEKNSYCTGEAGKQASIAAARGSLQSNSGSATAIAGESRKASGDVRQIPRGGVDPVLNDRRLQEALEREDARLRDSDSDERKRKYNSFSADIDVTEEDLEAYRRKRVRHEDPMADFLGDSF
jgi:pre-mRNA-processing factor SLU7